MARYLSAADFAFRSAMAQQTGAFPETRTNRYYAWEQRSLFGKINLAGPPQPGAPFRSSAWICNGI